MTIFSKHNQLIFSALASLFVLSSLPSCQREPSPVDENLYLTDELIRVEAQGSDMQTRGLLNSADLKKAGTTVKVYDYLTGFTGKMTVGQTTYDGTTTPVNVMYINDSVEYQDGDWNFSQYPWRWTRTGTHHFYGWLTHDGNGSGMDIPSGWSSFNPDSLTLSVGPITMNTDTPQFDFSYSEIKSVDVESDTFDPKGIINLPLKHLFSAVAFSIENRTTEDKYTIKSVSITGLGNKAQATLDYSGTGVVSPQGISPVVDGKFVQGFSGKIVLEHGQSYDVLKGGTSVVSNSSFSPEYFLTWPLTSDQVRNILLSGTYEIEGNVDDQGIPITNKFELPLTTDGSTFNEWKAGYKNRYSLVFTDKMVNLVYSVLPWEYVKTDMDFSDHTLSATPVSFTGGVSNGSNYLVNTTASTIVGSFQIWTPVGAIWRVSMKGDTSFFTLEDNEGTINPNENNGAVSFRIVPNTAVKAANPGTSAQITLNFTVETSAGDMLNANTEINRDNIKIIYN